MKIKEEEEKKMEIEMNNKIELKNITVNNKNGVDKNKTINEMVQKDKEKENLSKHKTSTEEIKNVKLKNMDDVKKDMDNANTNKKSAEHNLSEVVKQENKNQSQNSSENSHISSSQQTKVKNTNEVKEKHSEKERVLKKESEVKAEVKTEEEEEEESKSVFVKRIINVEISEEVKKFIRTFIEQREEILNWCNNNKQLYTNKINDKTVSMLYQDTENLNKILKDGSMDIDLLSTIIYFYNLFCTHNRKDKINFNDLMTNSHITYRGLYENIDTNSKTFKNLMKEERKYKLRSKKNDNTAENLFWHYKRTYPYGMSLIVGMCLTFISGYYGALLLGYHEFTTRLICGVIFSYLGLILEVLFYILIYEKSEKIKKRRINAIKNYGGLYKKINVSSSHSTIGVTSQSNVTCSSGLSVTQTSQLNQNETKKER